MDTQTHSPHGKFIKPTGWYKYFGLYDQANKAPIPLKEILVDAKINEYIAEITYSQLYYNNQDIKLETVYFFPISNTGCFHSFKATIGTRVVEGVIKKKADARQEYEQSTANNELAIYAETMEQDSSIMCIKIGNLPPKVEVRIQMSYIERVEISMNKFWSFCLSSTLLPRSLWTSGDRHGILTNYAQTDLSLINNENIYALIGFSWEVNILINSKRPFELLQSPSHEVNIVKREVSGIYSAEVSLVADKTCLPDNDFVLNYSTDAINTPNCLIGPFDKGYCALVSFCPDTSYLRYDDAYMAYLSGKSPFEDALAKAQSEFYFVVDRSEHMSPDKITLAKKVLREFLKNIPNGCYFNIVNFTGDMVPFEQQSVEASAINIEKAIVYAGDTSTPSTKAHIKSLFEHLAATKLIDGYPRTLIMLTSGRIDISTTEAIRIMNDKLQRTRVFTVGIGNSSHTDFVMQTAQQGYGTYDIIRSSQEVPQKVVHILQTSVAPYFTDFQLDVTTQGIHSCVIPVPKSIKYVMPNELVEFFIIFNHRFNGEKSTKFTLKFKNDLQNTTEKHEGEISIEGMDPLRSVVMLGIQKLCASHMEEIVLAEAIDNDTTRVMAENLKKSVEKNSIEHGILTPHTAFICIDKTDELHQTSEVPTQKFIITNHDEQQQMVTNMVQVKRRDDESPIGGPAALHALEATSNLYKFKIPNNAKLERDKGSFRLSEDLNKDSIFDRRRSHDGLHTSGLTNELPIIAPQSDKVSYNNIRQSSSNIIDHIQQRRRTLKKQEFNDSYKPDKYSIIVKDAEKSSSIPKAGQDQANRNAFFNDISKMEKSADSVVRKDETRSKKKILSLNVSSNPNVNSSQEEDEGLKASLKRDSKFEMISTNLYKSKFNKMWHCWNWMKRAVCGAYKSSKTPAPFDFDIKAIPRVLQLQQKDGFWEAKNALGDILNYKLEQLMKPLPESLRTVKNREEIWLTILMLAWIDHVKETTDQQNACNNAFKWLKQNDEHYTEHLEKAKVMIGADDDTQAKIVEKRR